MGVQRQLIQGAFCAVRPWPTPQVLPRDKRSCSPSQRHVYNQRSLLSLCSQFGIVTLICTENQPPSLVRADASIHAPLTHLCCHCRRTWLPTARTSDSRRSALRRQQRLRRQRRLPPWTSRPSPCWCRSCRRAGRTFGRARRSCKLAKRSCSRLWPIWRRRRPACKRRWKISWCRRQRFVPADVLTC